VITDTRKYGKYTIEQWREIFLRKVTPVSVYDVRDGLLAALNRISVVLCERNERQQERDDLREELQALSIKRDELEEKVRHLLEASAYTSTYTQYERRPITREYTAGDTAGDTVTIDETKDWHGALYNLQCAEDRMFRCQGIMTNAMTNLRGAYARVACLAEEAKGDG
jgi:hypothetical protein